MNTVSIQRILNILFWTFQTFFKRQGYYDLEKLLFSNGIYWYIMIRSLREKNAVSNNMKQHRFPTQVVQPYNMGNYTFIVIT